MMIAPPRHPESPAAVRATNRPLYAVLAGLLAGAVVATGYAIQPAPAGISAPGMVVHYGLPVARALIDLAASAMVGLALVPVLLSDAPGPRATSVGRGPALANVVVVLAALTALPLEVADLWPGRGVGFTLLGNYLRTEQTGQALLATAVLGLCCLVTNLISAHRGGAIPPELRLIAAGTVLLPLPLTGHGEHSLYHGLIMLTREAHVIAAATWTGGLFAIATVLCAHRTRLAIALPRYSVVATVALLVVGGTGVVDAVVEFTATSSVGLGVRLHSTYAGIVVAKIVCLIVLAALGGRIRLRLLPSIAAGRRTALLGWASAELAVMGLAYGLAAVLSRSSVVV